MARVSFVSSIFFSIYLVAVDYVSGKPSYKGSQLADRSEDPILALIVGILDTDLSRSESQEEKLHDENTKELINLLWKSKEFQQSRNRNQKSVELAEVSTELKSPLLRSGCYQAVKCQKKCEKKKESNSCQNLCKLIYDSFNQCMTTTRDPCEEYGDPCAKWGKTMPPKWKLLLRAITQQS